MQECDRYLAAMDLIAVREALRLLRVQSDKSLDEIEGLNRSTVHRIENVRGVKGKTYSPELSSVARIIEACGSTLAQFFTKLDALSQTLENEPDLLDKLADEQTVRQVLWFLKLPESARRAMTLVPPPKLAPTQPQAAGPTPAPIRAARTTHRPDRRRPSGPRKTGT
jgi:transcriptional regulator with XRE-family HTH domain